MTNNYVYLQQGISNKDIVIVLSPRKPEKDRKKRFQVSGVFPSRFQDFITNQGISHKHSNKITCCKAWRKSKITNKVVRSAPAVPPSTVPQGGEVGKLTAKLQDNTTKQNMACYIR